MILNDKEIAKLCRGPKPMIEPFEPEQRGMPSYGLGSFGYDIRLGERFLVPLHSKDGVASPLKNNEKHFVEVAFKDRCLLFPGTCILGESVEMFRIPDDVMCIAFGKSTYARLGVVPHVTPLESGWVGRLTIEIANTSKIPVELIVGQGIAQLIFFRGKRPKRTYPEKGGIYQNQAGIKLPQGGKS
ncbi:MAG: dCTP deaminase [Bdellovibrionaceae bacterium]|nr:dCTP deaminase [Pseudobdellovibrionaceae bacterium]